MVLVNMEINLNHIITSILLSAGITKTELVTGVNAELGPTCQHDSGVQVFAVVDIAPY